MSGAIQIKPGTIPGTIIASGYLTEFGEYLQPSTECTEIGGYQEFATREVIDRDAINHALAGRPSVRLIIDRGIPVAHTRDSTLKLSIDAVGLRMDAVLVEGDVDVQRLHGGESINWTFKVTRDEWSATDHTRRITGLSLDGCRISIAT